MEEIRVKALREKMQEVLSFVDAILEREGCPLKTQMQIDLAVEELFVNIADYAFPEDGEACIGVEILPEPRRAAIRFTDTGFPFDPSQREEPDVTLSAEERKIGGLGILLVKKIMDAMVYRREDGKNILTIEKAI